MKNKMIKLAVAAVAAIAISQTVQATPITGTIGFSGSAVLNSGTTATATQVVSWGPTNTVQSVSGTFPTALVGQLTSLASPWNFNSGALNSFWQVGGFTFNLLSSQELTPITGNGYSFINVILYGTVTGNGYDATQFSGSFQVADPSSNGQTTFTTRLSFNSVPDGGTTVMLLGATLSGLALIKRKLIA